MTRIDTSMLPFGKQHPVRDDGYKKLADGLACEVCELAGRPWKWGTVVLAHISFEGNAGTGIKAPDDESLFLCGDCHREFDADDDRAGWIVRNYVLPLRRRMYREWKALQKHWGGESKPGTDLPF